MRAAVAVFRDELAARRRFLLLALVAGLIPFAAVGLYPRGGASPADVRGATALAIAGTLGFLLAIGIGSSLFAPELASGRLRYWLCRPVSATALWLGRNAAALVAIYASVLLALFPTTLTGDLGWHTIDSISIAHAPGTPRVYLLFALLALALVFFLGQGLASSSGLAHAGSRWISSVWQRSGPLSAPRGHGFSGRVPWSPGSPSACSSRWHSCWHSPWPGSSLCAADEPISPTPTGSSR